MKLLKILTLFAAVILISGSLASGAACKNPSAEKLKMTVLVADSLILPFQEIEKAFEIKNPGIDVLTEGHGSIQVIRTITEIGKEADAALVADNQLIPLLMYQTQRPENAGPYADWYINFATNALGIAYTPGSFGADGITVENWYKIMSRPEVKIGLADPLIDSLAYRALMCVKLAQDYYQDDTLFDSFFGSGFKLPLSVEKSGDTAIIHIPEALRPAEERIIMRSYNLQVLALLESGNVDYAFEYESVARQHGLQFLKLPTEINLGSPDFVQSYRKISVKMDFQRFASVMPEFLCDQIIYAATIPTNAPHPVEAVSYLSFVLGSEGRQILKNNFQPPLTPSEADNPEKVPNNLVSFTK
jgi:molybdate/tungstate transport system substrate-binding protein